jgi:hypothetical protein
VRKWLRNEKREQAMLILGGAGIGKSAFMAQLVDVEMRGVVVVRHFCDAGNGKTLDVNLFVWGMVVSMLEQEEDLVGFRDAVLEIAEVESVDELETVFTKKGAIGALTAIVIPALNAIPRPDESFLFCLDSLDEASLGGREVNIVELMFARSVTWPRWLRVLVTSREQKNVMDALGNCEKIDLAIEDNKEENLEDIGLYVGSRMVKDVPWSDSQSNVLTLMEVIMRHDILKDYIELINGKYIF